MQLAQVAVVDGVHTPFAMRNGNLRGWHPVELSTHVLSSLAQRTSIPGADVIWGCATPIGEQGINIGRSALLAADWDERFLGLTIEAQATSGHLAIHAAIARVATGLTDICIAGAVEVPSRVPNGASTGNAVGKPFGPALHERYVSDGGLRSPADVAEHMAQQFDLQRQDLDEYAKSTIQAALRAQAEGVLKAQIITTELRNDSGRPTGIFIDQDELAEIDPILSMQPMFDVNGLITAANFSSAADGAAGVMLASLDWCREKGIEPLALVDEVASMGSAVLEGSSGAQVMNYQNFDRIEIDEDTAVTPLAFAIESKLSREQINPNGGSLAFGNPNGVVGVRGLVTLAHAIGAGVVRNGAAVSAGNASLAAATSLTRI